jgi:hypothetical protein
LPFLTQNKAKLCKIFIITLVFEKNAIFAENWQKSHKIAIITTTPGHTDLYSFVYNITSKNTTTEFPVRKKMFYSKLLCLKEFPFFPTKCWLQFTDTLY